MGGNEDESMSDAASSASEVASDGESPSRKIACGDLTAPASKWSMQQLRDHFMTEGLDYELMMNRIKDLIVKTLIAVEPPIVSAWHQGANFGGRGPTQQLLRGVGPNQTCFEILGFDIIIDTALKPWLLEVNTAPSLSSSSPLDKRIKTKLVADALTLVGIYPFDHKLVDKAMRDEQSNRENGEKVPNGQKSHNLLTLGSTPLKELGRAEWTTILDACDEFMRSGSLERIFPTPESGNRYSDFFQTPRYANAVLAKWLREGGENCFC